MASASIVDAEGEAEMPDNQATQEQYCEKRAKELCECANELDPMLPIILVDKQVSDATRKVAMLIPNVETSAQSTDSMESSIAPVMETKAQYLALADAYDACNTCEISANILAERLKDMKKVGIAFVCLETNAAELQEVSGDLLDDVPEGIPEDFRNQILDSAEAGLQAYHAARQALDSHRENMRKLREIIE